MIVLTQNSINQVVVTLTEKKITSSDIYLLEVINQTTRETAYSIIDDISDRKQRYNLFALGLVECDPIEGEITLPLNGFYIYNIYENPLSITDPSTLHLVESGKLLVVGDISSYPIYHNDNSDLIAYNPSASTDPMFFMTGNNEHMIDSDGANILTQ